MNKLIKLTKDHYVIVDDSEIKEGDWYYWEITKTIQIAKLDSLNRLPKNSDGSKKITHSTQPDKGMENVTFISPTEVKQYVCWLDETEWEVEFINGKLKLL